MEFALKLLQLIVLKKISGRLQMTMSSVQTDLSNNKIYNPEISKCTVIVLVMEGRSIVPIKLCGLCLSLLPACLVMHQQEGSGWAHKQYNHLMPTSQDSCQRKTPFNHWQHGYIFFCFFCLCAILVTL